MTSPPLAQPRRRPPRVRTALQLQVLAAIAAGPRAWSDHDEIAVRLPMRHPGAVRRAVEELLEAGELQRWDAAPGSPLTLSPAAAAWLELELIEVGVDELPRWCPARLVKNRSRSPRAPVRSAPRWLAAMAPEAQDDAPALVAPWGRVPIVLWGIVPRPLRRPRPRRARA